MDAHSEIYRNDSILFLKKVDGPTPYPFWFDNYSYCPLHSILEQAKEYVCFFRGTCTILEGIYHFLLSILNLNIYANLYMKLFLKKKKKKVKKERKIHL